MRHTRGGQWTAFALFLAVFGPMGSSLLLPFAVAQLLAAGPAWRTTPAWSSARVVWSVAGAGATVVSLVLRVVLVVTR
ncbi:MAG TPA: hypothetical protein VJ850_00585 [Candidatus Limnocylindrales bacterium]|nr:hypothetical protein [Candidatus Limnocylindrales bacterium]